jgi:hypothetical protein
MRWTLGTDLNPTTRTRVLQLFQFRPVEGNPNNRHTQTRVRYATDAEWLADTLFAVRKDGNLDLRSNYCRTRYTGMLD